MKKTTEKLRSIIWNEEVNSMPVELEADVSGILESLEDESEDEDQ